MIEVIFIGVSALSAILCWVVLFLVCTKSRAVHYGLLDNTHSGLRVQYSETFKHGRGGVYNFWRNFPFGLDYYAAALIFSGLSFFPVISTFLVIFVIIDSGCRFYKLDVSVKELFEVEGRTND